PGRRDMLVAVGEGKISADDLAREATALKGKRRRNATLALPVGDNAEGWFSLKRAPVFKFRVPGGQRAGVQRFAALPRLDFDMPVEISREGIVPGDRLIGILTEDGRMTVYPIHSDALGALHDQDVAWIDVRWDIDGQENPYPVAIAMQSLNRPGSLAQISSAIAACDANITKIGRAHV